MWTYADFARGNGRTVMNDGTDFRGAQEARNGSVPVQVRKARAQACVQLDGSCAPLFT